MKDLYISFIDIRGRIKLDFPNICPHCGRTMSPELVSQTDSNDGYDDKDPRFALTFRCSFDDCKKYFSVEYAKQYDSKAEPIKYNYRPPISVDIPEKVRLLSPMFADIYTQSITGEVEGLDLIAGVGFRKSAEFLIKDYAIHKNPDQQSKIEKQPLMQVINTHLVDFPKLQSLAKAVAWIGNDETHYTRKHGDKDLDDLKRFINSTVHFVAADLDVDEAFSFTSS